MVKVASARKKFVKHFTVSRVKKFLLAEVEEEYLSGDTTRR